MLASLNKEVDARFGTLFNGQMPTLNDELTMANVKAAVNYLNQYDEVLTKANMSTAKTPYEINMRLMQLQKYTDLAKQVIEKHLRDTQAVIASTSDDSLDPAYINAVTERWPTNDALYQTATQVMASHNQGIRNQRQFDAALRAKSAENETLKRDRDTFEQQSKQLAEQLETAQRRLKTFESSSAAASAAPPVASVAIDVGASRGTASLGTAYVGNALGSALTSTTTTTLANNSKSAMEERVQKFLEGMYRASSTKQQPMFKVTDR
jgi:hypothetical protein